MCSLFRVQTRKGEIFKNIERFPLSWSTLGIRSTWVQLHDPYRSVQAIYGNPSHSYRVSLPYGITQCYLPPDTSENTPPLPQPERLVLDLPTI